MRQITKILTNGEMQFDWLPYGVQIVGNGMIVATRIREPNKEPTHMRPSQFEIRRLDESLVIRHMASAIGMMTWRAVPGEEIIVLRTFPVTAQCVPSRLLDIVYQSLDTGPLRGIHASANGLRELDLREIVEIVNPRRGNF